MVLVVGAKHSTVMEEQILHDEGASEMVRVVLDDQGREPGNNGHVEQNGQQQEVAGRPGGHCEATMRLARCLNSVAASRYVWHRSPTLAASLRHVWHRSPTPTASRRQFRD